MEEIDCITYEPIRSESLISIKEGQTLYHFDVHTLLRMWRETNRLENPCTRNRLSKEVISKLEAASTNLEVTVRCEGNSIKYDTKMAVGKLILELCKMKGNAVNRGAIGNTFGVINHSVIGIGSGNINSGAIGNTFGVTNHSVIGTAFSSVLTCDITYQGRSLYTYPLCQSIELIPREQNELHCYLAVPTSQHNLVAMAAYLAPSSDVTHKALCDAIQNELKYGRVITS